MKIELHPDADSELAAEIDYYEGQEEGLGLRFYQNVLETFEWIGKNPTLPRLRKDYWRVNLKAFPFYIAYVVEVDLIWVLAIAHGSRKPEYWKSRISR